MINIKLDSSSSDTYPFIRSVPRYYFGTTQINLPRRKLTLTVNSRAIGHAQCTGFNETLIQVILIPIAAKCLISQQQ
jgi:hypothetical protein